MNSIWTIFAKEMKRIFSDKKMVFSLYVLPVIMVIGIYCLMVVLISSVEADQNAHVPTVAIYQCPDSFSELEQTIKENAQVIYLEDEEDLEQTKQLVLTEELDIIMAFDADFDSKVVEYQASSQLPNIQVYYNPSSDYSSNARGNLISQVLSQYKSQLQVERFGDLQALEIFSMNAKESGEIQDEQKANGKLLGSMVPYLVTILLFAGAMGIGIDMIAGEKERGTMATLLIAPVKRTHIVLGKMLAMMALSGLSALVYVVSMLLAVPFLFMYMMNDGEEMLEEVAGSTGMALQFEGWQIVMLLLIMVILVFVYVAIVTLASVFAKDSKEGSTYITPIYTIVMVSGMVTMFGGENAGLGTYCIPLYGAVMAMKNILAQNISAIECGATLVVHLLFGAVLVLVVAKAFSSEKVMFDA